MSAVELYERTVKSMPPSERLRLASLILNDLASSESGVDESGEWSEQDLADLTQFSLEQLETEPEGDGGQGR